MSERGPAFEAAVEAYEAARNERDRIIDHPDKTLPLDEYKRRIRDAQADMQQAHRQILEAWAQ